MVRNKLFCSHTELLAVSLVMFSPPLAQVCFMEESMSPTSPTQPHVCSSRVLVVFISHDCSVFVFDVIVAC